jgi:uncharacterized protein DUF6884
MKTIVLISCVSKKLPRRARAENLYVSSLFKKNLQYARSLKPDRILILSAKHGLLELDQEVEPYDVTLNEMSTANIRRWADGVISQLRQVADLKKDIFVFLAGERYRKYLTPHLLRYEIPMHGLGIGEQLHFLNKHLPKS